MPDRLHVAFINCHNLFPAGSVPDGPADDSELEVKIGALAATMREGCCLAAPDLVGLAEVGDKRLGMKVLDAVDHGAYADLWTGVRPAVAGRPQTGIMLGYRRDRLSPAGQAVPWADGPRARFKWLAAALQLSFGTRGVLWVVVNHWKSQLGGAVATEPQRMEAARQLGWFYLNKARKLSEAMMVLGDFNCEPADRSFHEQRSLGGDASQMRAVRERPLVLRERLRLAYLYNPMWRWLGEPDPWGASVADDYRRPRPIGSFALGPNDQTEWRMWDQLMVSKTCLRGPFLRLEEDSIRLVPPHDGCSDHHALCARFDCSR